MATYVLHPTDIVTKARKMNEQFPKEAELEINRQAEYIECNDGRASFNDKYRSTLC